MRIHIANNILGGVSCYNVFMSKNILKQCIGCKSEFYVYKSSKKKYCTHRCFLKSGNARRGIKHTEETIALLSRLSKENPKVMATVFSDGHKLWDNPKSKKNWFKKGTVPKNYKGGERNLYKKIKDDARYKRWRKAVLERDDYTCQGCGIKEKLHCHHIKKSTEFIDLAYNVDNGVVLCTKCHGLRHRK